MRLILGSNWSTRDTKKKAIYWAICYFFSGMGIVDAHARIFDEKEIAEIEVKP